MFEYERAFPLLSALIREFYEMVFGFLSHAISVVVGAVYPAFRTFKVLRSGQHSELVKMLKYWSVYAGYLVAELVGDFFLLQYLIPGYAIIKLGFLAWTVSPWTNGAALIHQKLIAPFFTSYEREIDSLLRMASFSLRRHVTALSSRAANGARNGILSLVTHDVQDEIDTARMLSGVMIVTLEEQDEEDIPIMEERRAGFIEEEIEERSYGSEISNAIASMENDDQPEKPKLETLAKRGRKAKKARNVERKYPARKRRVAASRSNSCGRNTEES